MANDIVLSLSVLACGLALVMKIAPRLGRFVVPVTFIVGAGCAWACLVLPAKHEEKAGVAKHGESCLVDEGPATHKFSFDDISLLFKNRVVAVLAQEGYNNPWDAFKDEGSLRKLVIDLRNSRRDSTGESVNETMRDSEPPHCTVAPKPAAQVGPPPAAKPSVRNGSAAAGNETAAGEAGTKNGSAAAGNETAAGAKGEPSCSGCPRVLVRYGLYGFDVELGAFVHEEKSQEIQTFFGGNVSADLVRAHVASVLVGPGGVWRDSPEECLAAGVELTSAAAHSSGCVVVDSVQALR